ncbi:ankyrin repeat domain-containing protein [Bodo saltans virus]|uniref:Ankyrin repeat domain-containing protein n=1 Tax=Bodo saltans virus TaxID=2024608 RepID=A0A2H4UWK3_9VIRU|nr:ankyrin repeat domain-containing protein [Bodo saltans virus]ATZ81159.1 ankyrin repeat domain-containing protein [Bodo saltans virus]
MNFPFKVEHYDIIYNELCQKPIFNENENEIIFEHNEKIIRLFKCDNNNNLNYPPEWIKYYAPNIGTKEKWNFNHEFPFWIDNLIFKCKCHTMKINDINNKNMMCKLYYFYGSISTNNYITKGVFEYFINGTGTLFHRMFRQYYKLQPELQKIFGIL